MNKANGVGVMKMLRRQKPDLPVFIVSKTMHFRKEAEEAGANGYFVLPDSEQQLVNAILLSGVGRSGS